MKLSLLVGGAIGYVLGSRAGRERYEHIVAVARRIAGSQTVQATAGVLQAQLDSATARARGSMTAKIQSTVPNHAVNGANGHRH